MRLNKLTPEEERVIIHKGTEAPFSGEYLDNREAGTYVCRRCGAVLYKSSDKFDSGCGWPSFDDEIKGAVQRKKDGDRTEILCKRCGAHLGHVFLGEGFTKKSIRHCINSVSLKFMHEKETAKEAKKEAIVLGGGCFWCTEAIFSVLCLDVVPGYAGGKTKDPSYEQVCSGKTDHAEVVLLDFDPEKLSLNEVLEIFFASHDPTTMNRQGNDVGTQYRSIILFTTASQKQIIKGFIEKLRKKYTKKILTEVKKLSKFYPAESYHHKYYEKNPEKAYCRLVIKPKIEKFVEKSAKS